MEGFKQRRQFDSIMYPRVMVFFLSREYIGCILTLVGILSLYPNVEGQKIWNFFLFYIFAMSQGSFQQSSTLLCFQYLPLYDFWFDIFHVLVRFSYSSFLLSVLQLFFYLSFMECRKKVVSIMQNGPLTDRVKNFSLAQLNQLNSGGTRSIITQRLCLILL